MIEHLRNLSTDLIRGYYRDLKGIARAQDVSFLYANTEGTHVRAFTVALAAVQTLESERACLMYAFPELLRSGGSIAVDFSQALIKTSRLRNKQAWIDWCFDRNRNCSYHYHDSTPKCKGPPIEPVAQSSPEAMESLGR